MYDRHCLGLEKKEIKSRLEKGESFVLRLKVPEGKTIEVEDLIRGVINFDSRGIDDQVLLKSDGFPTYHLAAVVDDHLMEISHILRGVEWISSTPVHLVIYQALGWQMPILAHVPYFLVQTEVSSLNVMVLNQFLVYVMMVIYQRLLTTSCSILAFPIKTTPSF